MKIKSVWGEEDTDTVKAIKRMEFAGKWLDLAAGDGRYVDKLIDKVNTLVLADLDKNALETLIKKIPTAKKKKIEISLFDITKRFPFEDETFEGIFCTGTLHLFTEEELLKIVGEINRVLKSQGKIFFDFATDTRREMENGKLYSGQNESNYRLNKAKKMLKRILYKFNIKINKSKIRPQKINEAHKRYVLNCNFLIITGQKN